MKHLLLILLFSVMIFATDKQIIIGSYTDEKNSINALKELSLHVEKDKKLHHLIKINSLRVVSKKIENYNVVSILPLSNYVQLLRTLNALKKYYPDSYVIDYLEISSIVEPENTQVKVIEVIDKQKPLMRREENIVKKVKLSKQNPELKDTIEENKDYLLILLAFIIIVLAIYMRKKEKKEE